MWGAPWGFFSRSERNRRRRLLVETLENRALLASLPMDFGEEAVANGQSAVDLTVTPDGTLYSLTRDLNQVSQVAATSVWSGYARDSQHTAVSSIASQPLRTCLRIA